MAKPSRQDTQLDSLALVNDRLRLLATRSSEMWWEIGQALDEVATRMLSQNLGYPDYAAYAHEVLGIDAAQARRIRRVAHHFSREVALRFGAERLDLLLDYTLNGHPLRVPDAAGEVRAEPRRATAPTGRGTVFDRSRYTSKRPQTRTGPSTRFGWSSPARPMPVHHASPSRRRRSTTCVARCGPLDVAGPRTTSVFQPM